MDSTNKLPLWAKLLMILVGVVAIVGLASTLLLWQKLEKASVTLPDSDAEIAALVEEVGKYILLPENETPTLITVESLEQVKGQPFFINALIGDKVLIYKENAKAVMWRPATKKIIEVAQINLSASQ